MAQFSQWLANAWEFLNKPLPVVGISILMICWFAFLIFKRTSFGKRQLKKINEGFLRAHNEVESLKKEYTAFKEGVIKLLDEKQTEINFLKDVVKQICDATPNKKVKAIGEKIYGREETPND